MCDVNNKILADRIVYVSRKPQESGWSFTHIKYTALIYVWKTKEKYRKQPAKRFLGIGFLVTVTQTILSMAMHGFVPNQFNTIEREEKTSNFLPNRTLQRNVLPQEMVANINYEC